MHVVERCTFGFGLHRATLSPRRPRFSAFRSKSRRSWTIEPSQAATYDARVETTVEIGGWEHECCGPAIERNEVVEFSCFTVSGGGDSATRLIETHHDLDATHDHVVVRGRVVDISVLHTDGSTELLARLPSGRALRGFDEHDDGHLETAWTGESVTADSDTFLITIAS